METIEVRAIAAIRRWSFDRTRMRAGQTMNYKRQGWQVRDQRHADSRIVRVVDFERAIGQLPEAAQVLLMLRHVDGYSARDLAEMSKTSVSNIERNLSAARQTLGTVLDIRGLL